MLTPAVRQAYDIPEDVDAVNTYRDSIRACTSFLLSDERLLTVGDEEMERLHPPPDPAAARLLDLALAESLTDG